MINLNEISFIVSSNRETIHTLKSIPKECELIIPRSNPLGRARNEGISKATKQWIILCDDDIEFSRTFLDLLCELAREQRIIGLEAYYPSPFVIGRLMLFSKNTWLKLGEFDIKSHGDETEWQLRAIGHDYEILRLGRNCVYHYPHQKVKPISEFGNLFYLLRKHPKFPLYILRLVITKLKDSSYNEEYRCNHIWTYSGYDDNVKRYLWRICEKCNQKEFSPSRNKWIKES